MSAEFIRELDATIFGGLEATGMTDQAIIAGRSVTGIYRDEFVESESGEISVVGTYHSFDCREEALAGIELTADDPIEVRGWGQFRFLRSQPGNAGRVLIVLGKWL